MSPLRLKAVLLAGQARLPKIGTNAGTPKEPHLLNLRQDALRSLLLSLSTAEDQYACNMLLNNDNLLLTMPEIDFQAYLRGDARSKYRQVMHNADALLSVGRPSRSESLAAAEAMRKQLHSAYLRALFRLNPPGRARFVQLMGRNVTKDERLAACNAELNRIELEINNKYPQVKQAMHDFTNSGDHTREEGVAHLTQLLNATTPNRP